MSETIIKTRRIILRKFLESDAQAVFDFGSNHEVQRYTGEVPLTDISQARDIIVNTIQKDYKAYGYGRWAVVYRPEQRVIGFAGLKYLPEFQQTDIGYRILPEYWGKGITTEMCFPIMAYGFNILKLDKIIGIALPENKASLRVLEKIGLRFEKVAPYDESNEQVMWYALNRKEYLKNNM